MDAYLLAGAAVWLLVIVLAVAAAVADVLGWRGGTEAARRAGERKHAD